MMMHRWRGVTRDRDKKAHGDLNQVWTSTDTHQPPVYHGQTAKTEILGNCMSRNLIYKFCIGRMLTDCVEDASIAMCENA